MFALHVRRYAPFDLFGLGVETIGFKGDERTQGTVQIHGIRSKTVGIIMFDFGDPNHDDTTETCGSGFVFRGEDKTNSIVRLSGGQATPNVTMTITNFLSTPTSVSFDMQTWGANPLIPSPSINTNAHFSATSGGNILNCNLTVTGDIFPSCDVVLERFDNNTAALLLDYRVTSSATNSLLGPLSLALHLDKIPLLNNLGAFNGQPNFVAIPQPVGFENV